MNRMPRSHLAGLPEVQVRHHQAGRAAVLSRDGAGHQTRRRPCRDPRARPHVGRVGGITAVGKGHQVRRRISNAGGGEKIVDGDALPRGVQLAPLGDAVDVGVDFGLGQRTELLPVPLAQGLALRADQDEAPLVQRDALGGGRQSAPGTRVPGIARAGMGRGGRFAAPSEESSGDHVRVLLKPTLVAEVIKSAESCQTLALAHPCPPWGDKGNLHG